MLFKQLASAGRTTGEQTQEKIDYTKLNFSRTKRLDKTAEISEESIEVFKNISDLLAGQAGKQTWLVKVNLGVVRLRLC